MKVSVIDLQQSFPQCLTDAKKECIETPSLDSEKLMIYKTDLL